MSLNDSYEEVKSTVNFFQGTSSRKALKISVEEEGVRKPVLSVNYESIEKEVFNRAFWVVRDGYLRDGCTAAYKVGESATVYDTFTPQRKLTYQPLTQKYFGVLSFEPKVEALAKGATLYDPISIIIPTKEVLAHGISEEPYTWLIRYSRRDNGETGDYNSVNFSMTSYKTTDDRTLSFTRSLGDYSDIRFYDTIGDQQAYPTSVSRQEVNSRFYNAYSSAKTFSMMFNVYDLCLVPVELVNQVKRAIDNR